ncbi:hypothetical protein QQ008_20880 [Fulvivirgaceae bacterium BMA10]|uniref:Peptidase M48 domain-containing protein n=2 Tax=Splendidivirga corallicola TaxID=3051826 RepID=A0ABT8KSZ6_9BACT|nr:hypothetical protein [Fulvivirgaceae bacterium BMA10]
MEKIKWAIGDSRQLPQIEIRPGKSENAAILIPNPNPRLILDEKVYDLCRSFGSDSLNALASIIGHELAHFYRDHKAIIGLIGHSEAENLDNSNRSSQQNQRIYLEAEADYFGTFYAFQAGFNSFKTLPKILSLIYNEYQLPNKLSNYPSKQERINIAVARSREMEKFAPVFEVGRFLYTKKYYKEAEACFEYVTSHISSKEAFNNLGVAKLTRVSTLTSQDETHFAYPFEIDVANRLSSNTRGGSTLQEEALKKRLLQEAELNFEKAISFDRYYWRAYINLAITQIFLKNFNAAIGEIDKLRQRAASKGTPVHADAFLVRGIALVKAGRMDEARQDFLRAREGDAFRIDYNFSLFKKLNNSWLDDFGEWEVEWTKVERWIKSFFKKETQVQFKKENYFKENINSIKTIEDKDVDKLITINGTKAPVSIHFKFDLSINTYLIKFDYHSMRLLQTHTTEGNITTSKGLKVGDDQVAVRKKYGSPGKIIPIAKEGFMYVYEKQHIHFWIIKEKVAKWEVYEINRL